MAGISPSNFFKEIRDASEIKSEILNAYFKAWAAILLKGQKFKKIDKLIYVDLFSGPGKYDDGRITTPLKILNSIHESKGNSIDFDKSVQTFFNDNDTAITESLKTNIEALSFYEAISNKPQIANETASLEILKNLIEKGSPSLTFIDPLGYGYTQEMLFYSVKSWGSDLFMLFNLNRIRGAIMNKKVEKNMKAIFAHHFDSIREFYLKENSPYQREKYIIEIFEKIFEEQNYLTLKFKVNFENKNQTSHYLFFVSKVAIAIRRAKEIMTKYSDTQRDGVPLFGANIPQGDLFFPTVCQFSILKLKDELYTKKEQFDEFTIDDIYKSHHYKTNYIKSNYKKACAILLQEQKIILFDKKGKRTNKITYTARIKFK